MGARTLNDLIEQHRTEILEESAVAEDVATARGYRSLTGEPADRDLLSGLGFRPHVVDRDDAYPALMIPMHNRHGEHVGTQIKPAVPRARVKPDGSQTLIKYETPTGAPLVVDVPAFTREHITDLSKPLWITEGMKKVDALVSHGLLAVGLTGVFNWRSKMGTLGDWEDIPIRDRPVVLCFDADAATNRNVQLAMGRLGAWLRSRGASKVHYVVVPASVGETETKGVDDYFRAGGTVADLASAEADAPPGQGAKDAAFTDAFLVESLASEALEGRFSWAAGLGWMRWDGVVWKSVTDVDPTEAVRQWASSQFDAVLAEQSKDKSKNLSAKINGWRGILSRSRIMALVGLARGIAGVQADAVEFDSDPDLLTARNGTIHLPSGTLRPHDPADRITRCCDAEYRPGFRNAAWDKALEALPESPRGWFQDRIGQSVTGYKTPDHVMVISHGGGENGKSTLADAVMRTLGSKESSPPGYAVLVSDRALTGSSDSHPTELMDFRGARYAVLEETPEARHLNTERLKKTVGTPQITARHIRENSVTFKATHSLFINTNFRPVVTETDRGTWRRLALLSFPYTYKKRAADVRGPFDRLGDPRLEFASDDPDFRAACLAWMVDGARAWYARDRMMMDLPETVAHDTRSWRSETDLILAFADECLEFDPEGFVPTSLMMSTFNEFLTDRGHRPWNDKTLGSRLGSHETMTERHVELGRKFFEKRQQRGWLGVRLRESDQPKNPFA